MCDKNSRLSTDPVLRGFYECNPQTGHYDIICPNSGDEETQEACLVWSSAPNPEASLGPPAVKDGSTNFACYDPSGMTLQICKGTCKNGKCVTPVWKRVMTAAVIVGVVAAVMYGLSALWKKIVRDANNNNKTKSI